MDVETCKEYYEALTRYVFYTDKTILGMPYGNTLFKASRLEEAIKVCVRECRCAWEPYRLDSGNWLIFFFSFFFFD